MPSRLLSPDDLNPNWTFESYLAITSEQVVAKAELLGVAEFVRRMADREVPLSRPIAKNLYGTADVDKSHLLQALAERVLPQVRVLFFDNPSPSDLRVALAERPYLVIMDHLFVDEKSLDDVHSACLREWAGFLTNSCDSNCPIIVTASNFSQADINKATLKRVTMGQSEQSKIKNMPLTCVRLDGAKRGFWERIMGAIRY